MALVRVCVLAASFALTASPARAVEFPPDTLVASGAQAAAGDSLALSPGTRDSLSAFPPPLVRAWQVGLARSDRLEHLGLSFTLAAALTIATRDESVSAGTTIALGIAKEVWDSRGTGRADAVDLLADVCGIALALVCIRGPAAR